MRDYSIKTALKTALVLSAAIVMPAAAQTLETLDPSSGWSVTRLKDAKQADYCALSRPYSNNSVLTLARNATKEYSLAVDFQGPEFDPEKPYALTLQPGLGQLRAYEVLPTSPGAFVVRLGWDEGFLDALAESQELKLKIAQDRYNFKISDFGAGLNDLESCMNGLPAQKEIAPEKGDDIKEAKAPVKSEEVKAETPSQQASLLKAEAAQAEEGFKAKKMTAAPAMPAPDVPEIKVAKKVQDKKVEEKKVEDVKAAKAPAPKKVEIEPPQKAASIAPRVSKTPTEPESLKAEDLLGVKEKKSDNIQFETAKVADPVPAPKAPAEAKPVEKVKAKTPSVTPAPAAKAPEEPKISKRVLKAQKIETEKAEARAQKLEQDVARLQNKNNELRQQVNQVMADKDVNTAKKEKNSLAKIADLETKLAAATSDNTELSKKLDEYRLLQEDSLVGQASGDWTLEKATKRYNEAEREIQRLALQLESEKTSCRARTSQIENMLFDPAVAEKEQITRLMSLEKELDAARVQLADQNKAVEARVAERLAAEKDAKVSLQAQLKKSQEALQDTQAELAEANKKAAAPKVATEGEVASKEVAVLKTQVQVLTRQLGESEAALAKVKEMPVPNASKDKDLQKQIVDLQAQLNTAKQAEAQARDKAILAKTDLDKFRVQTEQTQTDESIRVDRLASLKLENDRLKSQLSLKDKESMTFRNQVASLQQDVAQAKRLSNPGEADRLKQELQSLRQQMARKEAQYQRSLASVQQDKTRLERAMAQNTNPAAAATPVQRRPIPEPAYARSIQQTPEPAPVAAAAAAPRGFSKQNLQTILASSGVSANSLRQAGVGAYQWSNGSLKGSAQVQPASVGAMDSQIQNYIAREKAQCSGDFASMPSSSTGNRSSYEIACITQAASQSSSVLFFEKEGSFVALSYETDAADMDVAMDARDKLAAQLTSMRTSAAW